MLGRVAADGGIVLGNADPFTGATIEPASPRLVADLETHSSADMGVGTSRVGEANLRRTGFNRHTFMCGQSGSGKSYALGVLLEQLLIDTDVPIIVLDPNADFVDAEPDARDGRRAGTGRVSTGPRSGCSGRRPDPTTSSSWCGSPR